MQFKTLTIAALSGLACGQNLTATLANNTDLSNLTSYLGLFPDLVSTLASLSNITLLAPNNEAFATLLNSSGGAAFANSSSGDIQALFQYHVLNGTYYNITNTTFIPTLLTNTSYTNVTGGQVVEAVAGDDGVSFFSGLLGNASAVGDPLNFTGGVIHIIDTVLTIPESVSATAVQLNLTVAAGALTNTSLVSAVDGLSDSTFFIPDNEAFEDIASALANLTTDQLATILEYHVVNGTVAYSTDLSNTSLPTLGGGNVTIEIVDGDVFVNSARVVIADVLVANGVVHVIDNVLNPGNATATADPSATTGSPAFPNASSGSVGLSTLVPTPTSSVATSEAPGATSSGGAQPMKTGAVGAAALFGGAAMIMNM